MSAVGWGMTRPTPSPVLHFYAGGTDARGRTLQAMLGQDDRWLEGCHDFIQWLFPLPEPSAYNACAPVLLASDIEAFRARPELRGRLLRAFGRMLAFYGFGQGLERGARPGGDRWITPGNHNFLRISRMLRSLHLLGCDAQAASFLLALESLAQERAGRPIGDVTLRHWRAAARRGHPG